MSDNEEQTINIPDEDFTKYVRRPFVVEAVRVTKENIHEIAKLVGEIDYKHDGTPFIKVDNQKVRGLWKVFPGFWMTRVDGHIRCYSNRVFNSQFAEMTEDIAVWVDYLTPNTPA